MRLARLFLLLLAWQTGAAADPMPVERGRQLYRNGIAGQPACIRCHGRHGEGLLEGGIRAPPLRQALGPQPVLDALRRAVIDGVDARGEPLHALMPRYRLAGDDLAALAGYLAILGTPGDEATGVSADAIRIGATLLPGADGAQVRTVLETAFGAVNAGGGIYGRRLELVVDPSAGEPVLAFVGSAGAPAGTPSIGALAPRDGGPSASDFELLPGLAEQGRVMVDQAAVAPGAPLVLVFDAATPRDALAAVREGASRHRIALVETTDLGVAAGLAAGTGALLFLGSGEHLSELARLQARRGMGGLIFASALQAGGAVFRLPADVARRLRLVYPAALTAAALGEGQRLSAYQGIAAGASAILVEALKRGGRQIDRDGLVQSIERLRDFHTDWLPPVSFGPNRHQGIPGMFMVTIDVARTAYVPYSERLLPVRDRVTTEPDVEERF